MIVVKIGGSAITDKKGFKIVKIDSIERVAKDIAEVRPRKLILVHGVGSFGHPFVVKYRLKEEKNLEGVVRAHMSCKELNAMICEAMLMYGLKPFPVHPLLTFKLRGGKITFDIDIFEKALEEGFIPVTHGDMVYDVEDRFFKVLSGDDITLKLAKAFKAEKIGFATDVEGVYVDGKLADVVTWKDLDKIGFSKGVDVTGGMRSKVEKILRSGVNARIFSISKFKGFLSCEEVGTLVKSD
ncbi:isopentenyl phosphate kinase [Archaeoglobus profundus]|uniref:Isopentenyl phosphate kinase n=1 Tax=Archaeoglobus profundus (strain DSM 5631 / JCM 9629 / NBRC 100127 / Av18) TaxID=572546 RepID=D2RER6_ARCPA|nr:isopentenyl phosphate kinase [Archaeoglobus profundus]ADB58610.1 aspartate/glutamate/uridylate kinase [Archaeoglobus profundus DSM 5631]